MINVQLIYRSYKPLHDLYASFRVCPPEGVHFRYPKPKPFLYKFYPLYLKYGDFWISRQIIQKAQQLLFDTKHKEHVDILHYLQMLPDKEPNIPFVVDFEHIISLANFVTIDEKTKQRIENILSSPMCRKIIPLSHAAKKTLQNLITNYDSISHKIEVVYPALANYQTMFSQHITYPQKDTLRLLFVGNSPYKKGLHELLAAFQIIENECKNIHLNVISDASDELKNRFQLKNVSYVPPRLTHDEIISKFYLANDLFVMPTHDDTFGMAMLFALSSGMPVVTTQQFASPEIVTSNVNGLFVKSDRLHLEDVQYPNRSTTDKYHLCMEPEEKLVQDLVQKICYLYQNRNKLNELSDNASNDFIPGRKFSIDTRNRKLNAIYSQIIS